MSKDIDKEIEDMFNGKDGNDLLIKLSILKHYDFDKFMDTMFESLMQNSDKVINPKLYEQKMKAINKLIQHYEEKEVFEKCSELLELKMDIEMLHDE